MSELDKKALKETEIRTRYITPAIVRAGWEPDKNQMRENYTIAPGKVVVRGKLHAREAAKFADYVLFLKPGLPLAVVEAEDPTITVLGPGCSRRTATRTVWTCRSCSARTAMASCSMTGP